MAARKRPATSATKPKKHSQAVASEAIELRWTLGELPTSQHRAGLAGLVLMVRWLKGQRGRKGTCEIAELDERGATLRVDAAGLKELFDATYAAATEERPNYALRKSKTKAIIKPLRTEERTDDDPRTGKPRTRTVYIYEDVVPDGAWLSEVDPTPAPHAYRKLWRDVTWSLLRAIPATRTAFQSRADGDDPHDWSDWWTLLTKRPESEVPQKSHFMLGAMEFTAEAVPFRDRARFQFLLNFWTYVSPFYDVRGRDMKNKDEQRGYAIAVPDVGTLASFCEELPPMLKDRSKELRAFRPRDAVVSLPAESGLDTMRALDARLKLLAGRGSVATLITGVDVFHLTKPGQSTMLRSVRRLHPDLGAIDEYSTVHATCHDAVFRQQRVANVIDRKPWHAGFLCVLQTFPLKQTFGSRWFRKDCRDAFKLVKENDMSTSSDGTHVASLEQLVHRFVGDFLKRRVDGKYGLRYDTAKHDAGRLADLSAKREKVAQEAFYAIRSRSGTDFVTYFAATLGSVPQFLRADEYAVLAKALHERTEEVRALAMLALSAHSWSPTSDTRSE